MRDVIQPMRVSILNSNHESIDLVGNSKILCDTNRLSELEKYDVAGRGQFESVNLICTTAKFAMGALFCGVTLVNHEDVRLLGFAGSLTNPQEFLREVAVVAVCECSCAQYSAQDEFMGNYLTGERSDLEVPLRLLVVPVRSQNGSPLGAFLAGIDANREFSDKHRELAVCFVANCWQALESQRLQSCADQRAVVSRRQAEILNLQKQTMARNDKLSGKVSRMARISGWEFDTQTGDIFWPGKLQFAFDLPADANVRFLSLCRILGRQNWLLLRKAVAHCVDEGVPIELEFTIKNSKGDYNWFKITGEAEFEAGSVHKVVGTVQDISGQKNRESVIKHIATHDELTGLANRKLLSSEFLQSLEKARQTHDSISLILIDADHFKLVNDNYGHNDGDQVLREFANRIQSCVRPQDLVARLGGDEFAVILANSTFPNELANICHRLQTKLARGIDHDGGHSLVTAKHGHCNFSARWV